MDTREFVDRLYSLWAKTSEAGTGLWIIGETIGTTDIEVLRDDDEPSYIVANAFSGTDAQFITAIHGALPQLTKEVHAALDEADRLDREKDELIHRIMLLEIELQTAQEAAA
ncbi:hypothetical protein [Nocardia yunnanensis]|uniref:hypothetical protein n=1 Tax=Nocardia yunnanensis TaxID=2382165 RepID=UPI001CA4675B|nr:hypothetical protein [Nocardia yunnanensis]